jgi:hypothetical protein
MEVAILHANMSVLFTIHVQRTAEQRPDELSAEAAPALSHTLTPPGQLRYP